MLLSSIVLNGEQRLCLKRSPSYVIRPYKAVSFVVVRHHWLGDNYWAAISYWLGLIALSSFGGVYLVRTYDAFGLRTGNRFLLVTDEVTYTFYICSVVWPFLLDKQATNTWRAEVPQSLYRSTLTRDWGTISTVTQF